MAQQFASPQEEIDHWKRLFEEKEEELADFFESSKELEAELEQDLKMSEKKLKDVTSQLNRVQTDFEQAMDKAKRSSDEANKMIHSLQDETETLRKSNKEMKREKQTLEQENDNLERQVRQTEASLQDLTEKMNRLLEENAFLQTELEEKHLRNQEIIQRLTDDIRDLRSELLVVETKKENGVSETSGSELTPRSNHDETSVDGSNKVPSDAKHVPVDGVIPSKPDSTFTVPSVSASATTSNGPAGRMSLPNLEKGSGSISLVNDILGLVKEMQQRLHSRDSFANGIESKH